MEPNNESGIASRSFKVDLDTPLEQVWWFLTIGAGMAILSLLYIGYVGGKGRPPDPEVLVYLPYAIWALILFGALWKLTDNYYIVDLDRRIVLYHFACAGLRRITPHLLSDQISGVAIDGRINASKNGRWYEYALILVEKSGKTHLMSDWLGKEHIPTLDQRAKSIAEVIDCECLTCQAEHKLVVDTKSSPIGLTLVAKPLHETPPTPTDFVKPSGFSGWALVAVSAIVDVSKALLSVFLVILLGILVVAGIWAAFIFFGR